MKRRMCMVLVGAVLTSSVVTGCGPIDLIADHFLGDEYGYEEPDADESASTQDSEEEKEEAVEEATNEATEEESEEAKDSVEYDIDKSRQNEYTGKDAKELLSEAEKVIDDTEETVAEYVNSVDEDSSQADMTEAASNTRSAWEDAADTLWAMYSGQASVSDDDYTFVSDKYERQKERLEKKEIKIREETGGGSGLSSAIDNMYEDAACEKAHALYRRLKVSLATKEVLYEGSTTFSVYWPVDEDEVPQEYKDFIENNFDEEYIEDALLTSISFMDVDNDGEYEMILRSVYCPIETIYDIENGEVTWAIQCEGTADNIAIAYIDDIAYVVHYDTTHGGREVYILEKYNGTSNLEETMRLEAIFEDQDDYDETSEFYYNDASITMEDFEEIRSDLFVDTY